MNGLRAALNGNRALAAMLLAAALFVRALVPTGYMAAPDARSITVTICADASGSPRQVQVPLGEKHDAGQDHQDKHSPCAFAGMAAATPAAPVLLAALAPVAAPAAPFAAQVVAIGRGLAAPPPPQTGPPIIA